MEEEEEEEEIYKDEYVGGGIGGLQGGSGGRKRGVRVRWYVFSYFCRFVHVLFGSNENPSLFHMCRLCNSKDTRMMRRCLPVSLSVRRNVLPLKPFFPGRLLPPPLLPLCPPRGVLG